MVSLDISVCRTPSRGAWLGTEQRHVDELSNSPRNRHRVRIINYVIVKTKTFTNSLPDRGNAFDEQSEGTFDSCQIYRPRGKILEPRSDVEI